MRKEKYIYERQTKKGSKYFQIQITFKDSLSQKKTYYESVLISDYPNRSTALKVAKKLRDDALHNIQHNKLILETPTVETLFKKKFDLIPVSLQTRKRHTCAYNKGIIKLADKQISKITRAELQSNINEYAETHTQDDISKYISIWSDIYKTALLLGYDVADYTRMLLKPKSKRIVKPKQATVDIEDFQKALNYLQTYRLPSPKKNHLHRMIWYLLLIAYYTGMRPAEILALGKDDIKEDGIHVTKSVGSSTTQRIAIIPTKTKQSIRVVPIHRNLREVLEMLLNEQNTEPLLTDYNGNLMNTQKITETIKGISDKLGIKFTMYMLRHNMATDLIKRGVNARTVQDILGHANFSMSVEYARSTKEEREQVLNEIRKNTTC